MGSVKKLEEDNRSKMSRAICSITGTKIRPTNKFAEITLQRSESGFDLSQCKTTNQSFYCSSSPMAEYLRRTARAAMMVGLM